MKRSLILFMLMFAGTLIAFGALDSCLRADEGHYAVDDLLLRKLRAYDVSNDVDVVFLGSSKIYRQVDTDLFSKLTGLRSFNFGVPALNWPEAMLVLPRLMKKHPRFLILDPMDDADIESQFLTTDRILFSHTWDGTVFALKAALDNDASLLTRLSFLRLHLQAFLYRFVHVGTLARVFQLATGLQDHALVDDASELGYFPLDRIPNAATVRRHRLLEQTRNYERSVDSVHSKHPTSLHRVARMDELIGAAEHLGLKVIVLKSPDLVNLMNLPPGFTAAGVNGLKAPSLSFTDPDRYPDFYRLENRFDFSHLNQKGAKLYTESVARELKSAGAIQ